MRIEIINSDRHTVCTKLAIDTHSRNLAAGGCRTAFNLGLDITHGFNQTAKVCARRGRAQTFQICG